MVNKKILLYSIINLTPDSFSDGGEFLDSQKALEHGEREFQKGADILELGGQSSNPNSVPISPQQEWQRIQNVATDFRKKQIPIGIDTYQSFVMEKSLELGVHTINDITGFTKTESQSVLKNFRSEKNFPNLVVMFSHNSGQKAVTKSHLTTKSVLGEILQFLSKQKDVLLKLGISEEKLFFDPGMGFFLGEDPNLSWTVLQNLEVLKQELGKIFISVSRKSFLGALLGGVPPKERSAASFALETLLLTRNIDAIRSHVAGDLHQARQVLSALEGVD